MFIAFVNKVAYASPTLSLKSFCWCQWIDELRGLILVARASRIRGNRSVNVLGLTIYRGDNILWASSRGYWIALRCRLRACVGCNIDTTARISPYLTRWHSFHLPCACLGHHPMTACRQAPIMTPIFTVVSKFGHKVLVRFLVKKIALAHSHELSLASSLLFFIRKRVIFWAISLE